MFDLSTAELIMGGALGLTVLGLTEVVKKALKASGVAAYLISLAVSGAATAYYLLTAHIFTLVLFIGYTLYVFAVANGIFKSLHTPTVTK
jgi:hypothetical protein